MGRRYKNYAERQLMQQLHNNVDAYSGFYNADEAVAAGAPLVVERPTDPIALAQQAGNPLFEAQFDLDFAKNYYSVAAGVYTPVAVASVPAALQVDLPYFIFGNSDFASGFANARAKFPVTGWTLGRPFIYGRDEPDAAYDATVTNQWSLGDLIIPFTGASGGTDYVAILRLRCATVGYGSLLDAISSDTFIVNAIRYVIPDETLVAQYNKQIQLLTLSLFGKNDANQVSPNSYKQPQQFQPGIVDVPIKVPMDKHKTIATYTLYNLTSFSWSIFVVAVRKLSA